MSDVVRNSWSRTMSEASAANAPQPLELRSVRLCVDLDRVLSEVHEIAVWVADGGRRQDDAAFLLRTGTGGWHSLAFSDPRVAELIIRMRALPGFDRDRLVDAVCAQSARVTVVWAAPPLMDDRSAQDRDRFGGPVTASSRRWEVVR
jgi:hypothetical protein